MKTIFCALVLLLTGGLYSFTNPETNNVISKGNNPTELVSMAAAGNCPFTISITSIDDTRRDFELFLVSGDFDGGPGWESRLVFNEYCSLSPNDSWQFSTQVSPGKHTLVFYIDGGNLYKEFVFYVTKGGYIDTQYWQTHWVCYFNNLQYIENR